MHFNLQDKSIEANFRQTWKRKKIKILRQIPEKSAVKVRLKGGANSHNVSFSVSDG